MIDPHILVVDDEELNLEIIQEFLYDTDYTLECFSSADEAWAHLQHTDKHYALILLDRMMPGMDGIQFLQLLKSDPQHQRIPVVLQTAAASPAEVNEGIAAGAYYYLAKPYTSAALLAIVKAATEDVGNPAADPCPVFATPPNQEFYEFRSPLEARGLACRLAALCQNHELVAMGLMELFVNAIEHGNLALTYQDKKRLRLEGGWEEEVERRLGDPAYADRMARVELFRGEGELVFKVIDCGEGFNWERYLEIDPARVYDPNGRGIAMARQLSFSSLEYQGCGNVVMATVRLAEEGTP